MLLHLLNLLTIHCESQFSVVYPDHTAVYRVVREEIPHSQVDPSPDDGEDSDSLAKRLTLKTNREHLTDQRIDQELKKLKMFSQEARERQNFWNRKLINLYRPPLNYEDLTSLAEQIDQTEPSVINTPGIEFPEKDPKGEGENIENPPPINSSEENVHSKWYNKTKQQFGAELSKDHIFSPRKINIYKPTPLAQKSPLEKNELKEIAEKQDLIEKEILADKEAENKKIQEEANRDLIKNDPLDRYNLYIRTPPPSDALKITVKPVPKIIPEPKPAQNLNLKKKGLMRELKDKLAKATGKLKMKLQKMLDKIKKRRERRRLRKLENKKRRELKQQIKRESEQKKIEELKRALKEAEEIETVKDIAEKNEEAKNKEEVLALKDEIEKNEKTQDLKDGVESIEEGIQNKEELENLKEGIQNKEELENLKEGIENKEELEKLKEGIENQNEIENLKEGIENQNEIENLKEGIEKDKISKKLSFGERLAKIKDNAKSKLKSLKQMAKTGINSLGEKTSAALKSLKNQTGEFLTAPLKTAMLLTRKSVGFFSFLFSDDEPINSSHFLSIFGKAAAGLKNKAQKLKNKAKDLKEKGTKDLKGFKEKGQGKLKDLKSKGEKLKNKASEKSKKLQEKGKGKLKDLKKKAQELKEKKVGNLKELKASGKLMDLKNKAEKLKEKGLEDAEGFKEKVKKTDSEEKESKSMESTLTPESIDELASKGEISPETAEELKNAKEGTDSQNGGNEQNDPEIAEEEIEKEIAKEAEEEIEKETENENEKETDSEIEVQDVEENKPPVQKEIFTIPTEKVSLSDENPAFLRSNPNTNESSTETDTSTSLDLIDEPKTHFDLPKRKYSSQEHEENRNAFRNFQNIKKRESRKRHARNAKISVADLNYSREQINRNHNSHVHRVGSAANRAYYTYFSLHPSLRQSQWTFHNSHHGVVRGWHNIEDV